LTSAFLYDIIITKAAVVAVNIKGETKMAKNYDYGSKSITSWGYVRLAILYAIPVLGWLVWLINALFAKNTNVKNFARSYFCWVVLVLVLAVVAFAAVGLLSLAGIDVLAMLGLVA
jgi:hypothetical protein